MRRLTESNLYGRNRVFIFHNIRLFITLIILLIYTRIACAVIGLFRSRSVKIVQYNYSYQSIKQRTTMFAGHLGVALIAKRMEPKAPLWLLVGAAYGLDLLWPIMLLAGIETVSVDPGNTAFTPMSFDSYPWSHSLVMTLVWAGLIGFTIRKSGGSREVARIIRMVFISHWLQDFLTHGQDMPLWPFGPRYGLGLWNSIPGTLVIEGVFLMTAVFIYAKAFPARDLLGTTGLGALVGLVLIIWVSGPFSPPPPNATAIALVTLALWIFPLWAWRIEAHRQFHPATENPEQA